jgi:flagellar protein FliS
MSNGYAAYQQNSTLVESPEKLIEMLYEGIMKFTSLAKGAIEKRDMEKKVYYINRATAIYLELIASLDMKGGDIAHYLYGLYEYQIKLLNEVVIENSIEKIEEAIKVSSVLLEAWREETAVESALA